MGGVELLPVSRSYRGGFREEVILHDLQLSNTCRCVYVLLPRQPRLRKHASEKMGGGDRGRKLRAEGQPALLKKKLRGETGGNASQMKRARLDVWRSNSKFRGFCANLWGQIFGNDAHTNNGRIGEPFESDGSKR